MSENKKQPRGSDAKFFQIKRSEYIKLGDPETFLNRSGNVRTADLFIDLKIPKYFRENPLYLPMFTVKKANDHGNFLSLRKLYFLHNDPMEQKFSEAVFGSLSVWETIASDQLVKPYVEEWRKELRQKIRTDALNRVLEISGSESENTALSAAKVILSSRFWELPQEAKQVLDKKDATTKNKSESPAAEKEEREESAKILEMIQRK